MLVPKSKIIFENFKSNKIAVVEICNNIEIEKSRKTLTNTCKITLPRKIKFIDGDINDVFTRGGKVTVMLGYDKPENLKIEFTGYIARVDAKTPYLIYCEDEMWNLKQNSFSKAFNKVTLKELIGYIYTGKSRVADLQLGGFVIKQQSTAQVLEALKKFSIQCYFDSDGALVADFAGSLVGKPIEVRYDFNTNIIDNDLEYTRKEDIRIRVKGISKLPDGKKIEVFFGDADGDERSLNYVNLDKSDLTKIVQKELDKLKQDGFKNSFTTFGQPYAEPGYVARLTDALHPEREGSYLIESTVVEHGIGGFRRKVTLERKLA